MGTILFGIIYINKKLVHVIVKNIFAGSISLDDSENWMGGKSYEDLKYAETSKSQYMNLYVPDGLDPMPLIILVHGGGFVYNDCESRQAQFMYRYFRDQGYACASINYRLSGEAGFPAAIEDVKAAVRFLRANAGQYGYDPEKFVIWGESAGGYLATMAAVTDEEFSDLPFIGEDKLSSKVSGEVSALVNFYGVIDFDYMEEDFKNAGIPSWVRVIANYPLNRNLKGYQSIEDYWLRKSIDGMTKEELQLISPRYYLEKNYNCGLKVLIQHGDVDITVPYLQSERLADTFTEVLGQEKVTYQLIPGYKHGDDKYYSDKELGRVKAYLDEVFANKEE
jgi:acetyl esterase/lipase